MARMLGTMPMHHVLIVMFAVCLCVVQAQAQGIGLVTGSEFGTYIRFGHDIAKVARSKGVDIVVKESEGSLANIRRMMSQENAGLGIVQSDVLSFLTTSADASMRSISSRIRLVFPFYNEEVHLFARKDIQQLSDLNGKRVVVGTKGSGNWLTANNILRIANIRPGESLEMPPGKAVSAVLTNEADAMFYIAGKPVPVFTRIQELLENPSYAPLVRQVHFLALDDPDILNEYVASNISSQDYAWLEGNVHTAAVKAVLVSVDFSSQHNGYYRQRCTQLKNLGEAIRERFDELKNSGHPKWQEVDLEQKIGIWQQDTCSSLEKVIEENIMKPEALNASMPEPNTLPAQEPSMLLNKIEKILTSESK